MNSAIKGSVLFVFGIIAAQASQTITGTIYCDNSFEFYFNGILVAKDPIAFTPHNAVKVSFEWDGVQSKTYAIMCEDYATSSGYEYTQTANPQLGDGALLASFSDGTKTSSSWKVYVAKSGPTSASVAAGCSGSALDKCAVEDKGNPVDWYSPTFDTSSWTTATTYSEAEAGWGMTPSWKDNKCCTMTSPLTRAQLGCSVDSAGNAITVKESECQDPKATLGSSGASFIWSKELKTDNRQWVGVHMYVEKYERKIDNVESKKSKLLFRVTVAAGQQTTGLTSMACSTPLCPRLLTMLLAGTLLLTMQVLH